MTLQKKSSIFSSIRIPLAANTAVASFDAALLAADRGVFDVGSNSSYGIDAVGWYKVHGKE